ncbi:insulin-like growth factor-binding protein 4 [Ambystoma mexicanum]|uniref:insulin-like growth factor-binding protein 4 n=1 Tax=Ambystoma mexicanum TaxID=8296 RepID=UPI0037E9842C
MGTLTALLLLAAAGFCQAEEAIRCPPCSVERLARCRAPGGCEELVKEPGCGCCATCALGRGTPCGVYTPSCGAGLRCYPPRGAEKPLHTLMHGQGICTELAEVESIQESLQPADKQEDAHPNNSLIPCSVHDRICLERQWAMNRLQIANGGKKKTGITQPLEARPMGSCAGELRIALEKLSASPTRTQEDLQVIPIPNCDRDGNFHPKQCHPALDGQRGKCWCVDQKTGVKIHDVAELNGDLECQEYVGSSRK